MSTSNGLKRNSLSALQIVILVLSAASPLIGLTGAVPAAMVSGGGLATPFGYLVVGALLMLFAVGYVAMSRKVTNAGALYAYIGRGLGLRAGLGGASVAIWAYTTVQLAVYGFFGALFEAQFKTWTNVDLPWWVCTLGLIVVVQIFGWLQIEVGAKLLLVLMALEWGVMILLAAVVAFTGGAHEGFATSQVFDWTGVFSGGFSIAIVFGFASMFGFESSAIYGEEVRDPKRSVARATYSSVIAITAFFLLTGWMMIVAYGPSKAIDAAGAALQSGNPAAYVFDAAGKYLGAWAPSLMGIFVITSIFACSLAFHNGISRYLFTLGRDGVLPKKLGTTGPNGAPRVASVTQTITAVALLLPFIIMGSDPVATVFFWGSGIAVIGVLMLYIGTSISVFSYFRKNPDSEVSVWRSAVAPLLSAGSLLAALVLILNNFELLTGGTHEFALGLAATNIVALVIGIVAHAVRFKNLSADAAQDLAQEIS